MDSTLTDHHPRRRITLALMPIPAKALATCIIMVLAIGMLGALGQIVVHDIIPTFFSQAGNDDTASQARDGQAGMDHSAPATSKLDRGDLFADLSTVEKKTVKPFYQQEQFVWTLKWTHIHLFGMSMIFIFVGAITIWLDVGSALRTWLVVLPFIGVLVDILAMWLKAFVSPAFFWLHVPGGGLFAGIFAYVSLRAIWEMWLKPKH
ncbi:hypothetical protein DSCW_48580 [Desulfosarcina widdelii]|uniref:Uncharacterized protein n=1 Tax=Desulfosarcina widdelii TaxID=947919 RepID=A0A5K7ZCI4_9BACT|nr:hypothetical protein [Desulfosarcina widdelii]BBO77441.1 hypothetical protein DSCW_48580 [Desulfosarcina widdelii]